MSSWSKKTLNPNPRKKKWKIRIHREITVLGLYFYILDRGGGHPLFFNLRPLGSKVGGGLKGFDISWSLGVLWAKNWMKMGRFCGILGPWCWKFRLKCLLFWPWGFPKEGQDEVFRGAILKNLECLQTILFTTLEPRQRSYGRDLRTIGGALSWGFLRSFEEVGCWMRMSAQSPGALGWPWGALGRS